MYVCCSGNRPRIKLINKNLVVTGEYTFVGTIYSIEYLNIYLGKLLSKNPIEFYSIVMNKILFCHL